MPKLATLDSKYISYSAELEPKQGHLIYRRSIALKKERIPKEDYGEVNELFTNMYQSDRQRVVISRDE